MLSLNQLAVATTLAGIATQASPIFKRELKEYTRDVQIHDSCNSTQVDALRKAMDETYNITTFSRDYVSTNGPDDQLYLKWFGDGDFIGVLGAFDAILYSNKANVTFRCDNPDGNCDNDGWGGHWRGPNATQETVICPLSFEVREHLDDFCENNYTVAEGNPSSYWALDLVHRLYHVPSTADEEVGHIANSYADCIELAQHNGSWTPYNTHTLQYFMAEAYANEVARPGEGCLGEEPELAHDHDGSDLAEASSASDSQDSGVDIRTPAAALAFGVSVGMTTLLFSHTF